MTRASISIETKEKIQNIFIANDFVWKNEDRGKTNTDEWRGLIYYRKRDNAWACLTQRASIVLTLDHYDGQISGVECQINKALKGSVHGEYVHNFKNGVGVSLTCLNIESAQKAIEQYSMK